MNAVKTHRLLLFLFLTLFGTETCLFPVQASEYQDVGYPIVRHFTSDMHRNGSQNWAIGHDENNLIYFANSIGMSSWDGENWQQFFTPNKSIVRSLTRWTDGNFYAGTMNDVGLYAKDSTGKLTWKSLLSKRQGDATELGDTLSVASNDKQVIYSTKYAVLSWNGEKLQAVKNLQGDGFRVFNVDGKIMLMGKQHRQVYQISDEATPTAEPLNWQVPGHLDIKKMLHSHKGEVVLVSSDNGIFKLLGTTFVPVVSPQQFPVKALLQDAIQARDGYYYVASISHGVFILDENFVLLRQYQDKHGIGHSVVLALHEDMQGNIWIGGEPNISVMAPPHLRSLHVNSDGNPTLGKLLSVDGQLLSAGRGLYRYQPNKDPLQPPGFEPVGQFNEYIWDVEIVENQMLVGAESGLYAFDYANGNIGNEATQVLKANYVRALSLLPGTSTLYVGDEEYIYRLNKQIEQWQSVQIKGVRNQFEYVQLEYKASAQGIGEVLWASGADSTLYRLSGIDAQGKPNNIQAFPAKKFGLGRENVAPFLIDENILIGTSEGAFTFTSDPKKPFKLKLDVPQVMKTPGIDVFLLQKDKQGRLLYRTGPHTGVARLDGDKNWQTIEQPFSPFHLSGVLSFIYFNEAIWLKVNTGEIYRFSEKMLDHMPPLAKLNLRSITNINDESTLSNFASNESLPAIPYSKNSIRIDFALAAHSTPVQSEYRARISGQGHQNWTKWSTEAHKDFPLLAGGDYLFEVQARDPWQRVQQTKFEFTVLPPWYLSKTAWVIYVFIALGLLFLSGWLTQRWRTRKLKEQNITLENTVAERTKEVSAKIEELKEQQKLKDRFFSNVSHEFRTPLTLIIGPLETLLSEHKSGMKNSAQSLTATALNNANKMLALVGQVLDLNRLEVGKLPLRVSQYDIAELLRSMEQRFASWAQQENQTISCDHCEEPVLLYFDQDQIDKCIANLLSNAIKYSGKDSQLRLNLVVQENTVTIQVIDNGHGISEQAKDKVFDRFYQDKASEHNTTPGTGIGLSLVKEIVELHHGEISLTSALNQGCCFSLTLKKGKQHFSSEQLVEPIALEQPQQATLSKIVQVSEGEVQDKTTLLIIDDNAELRNFISLRLSANYRIVQAENGDEGFTIAKKELPDLIVSDVMMPGITGYELTKKLKNTPATRTIPVILLTAKASKRETVEGFASGADDYLTKPFDTSELIMRVNAQINIRKTIRDRIQFEQEVEGARRSKKSSFVNSIQTEVLNHLSKPEFSVEDLAKLLFMSRATLSRKCKDELGMSPRAYIVQTRMEHACNLLQADTLSVSEIAYAVGFESLAYFSRSFKKQLGKPPSEYLTN